MPQPWRGPTDVTLVTSQMSNNNSSIRLNNTKNSQLRSSARTLKQQPITNSAHELEVQLMKLMKKRIENLTGFLVLRRMAPTSLMDVIPEMEAPNKTILRPVSSNFEPSSRWSNSKCSSNSFNNNSSSNNNNNNKPTEA